MAHTKSRYQQDLGFTDGRMFAGPGDVVSATSGGSLTTTRIAAGDWSLRAANSTTGQIAVNVCQQILRRTGFFEDTQNAFGSTFGSGLGGFKAGPGGSGSGIPASAEYQGRPDTISAMAALQQLTPRTGFKIKGFKLTSFDVAYTVTTNDLTAITCRVDQVTYVNGVAVPTPTVILATGVNGLIVTNGAVARVVNVVIPTPVYVTLADTALWVELALQTPAGGTADFRGFDLNFEYNFN